VHAEAKSAGLPHPLITFIEEPLPAIREALEKHRGNVSAASRQLGISRNTIYRKMKSL